MLSPWEPVLAISIALEKTATTTRPRMTRLIEDLRVNGLAPQ